MASAKFADALVLRASRGCGPLVARTVEDMRAIRRAMDLLSIGRTGRHPAVGFVPTMGALHAGHLALCARARQRSAGAAPADFVVASVFVNPTQFAPHEDLGSYPRTWDTDLAQLDAEGVDVVFHPVAQEMYPPAAPHRTFVDLAGFDAGTPEGGARPGFFRGVATVVTKLLAIVEPTHACFGQKDGMQCIAVRQLVRDLNLGSDIDILPTQRAADGLALSSRNAYLSPEERRAAPAIYAALQRASELMRKSPEVAAAAEARKRLVRSAATWSPAEAEAAAQRAAQASRVGHGALPRVPELPEDGFITRLRETVVRDILAEV